jgi:phosphopantothenoylcysteine synthetase/decarboxylase
VLVYIVVAPNVNQDLARHPRFRANLRVLSEWGVSVLFDDAAPGDDRMAQWSSIVGALDSAIVRRTGMDGPACWDRR